MLEDLHTWQIFHLLHSGAYNDSGTYIFFYQAMVTECLEFRVPERTRMVDPLQINTIPPLDVIPRPSRSQASIMTII